MAVVFRTFVYASLFISLVFVYLPSRVLSLAGVERPAILGWPQIVGLILGAIGAYVGLSCVFAFAFIGKGTPAPFDPPRKLVVRGPYRYVRNPMYLAATVALLSATLFYKSFALLLFTCGFVLAFTLFVLLNEEPHLRRTFGVEYDAYCQSVHRWLPSLHARFEK